MGRPLRDQTAKVRPCAVAETALRQHAQELKRHCGRLDYCGLTSSSKHLELTLCHQRSCQQMLGIRQSIDIRVLSGFRRSVWASSPRDKEDANGDFTGRKALYLDSTTTVGFDDERSTPGTVRSFSPARSSPPQPQSRISTSLPDVTPVFEPRPKALAA